MEERKGEEEGLGKRREERSGGRELRGGKSAAVEGGGREKIALL